MHTSEKLVTLAELCGQTTEPLEVKVRRYLLGCIPIVRFDSRLWVVDYDDHWRVMVSKQDRIVGADYLKIDGAVRAWTYVPPDWNLSPRSGAAEIRQLIDKAIDLAYDQSLRQP